MKTTPSRLRNVLLFQGGGGLGAYQAGVFEGLDQAGLAPDWAVGTSIGAINAALIAGNRPHRRLEHLYEFWARVGQRWAGFDALPATTFAPFANFAAIMQSATTTAFGIPHFFRPRWTGTFAFGLPTEPAQASFYDVDALRNTLLELVDFDYLAHSDTRLSVGAVDVETADIVYFDSRETRLEVEHILASCALPPAFAPVEINGRHYWDGGIHSNTPMEWILRDAPRLDSLCFLATLWPTRDTVPNNIADVLKRAREIRFASRANTCIGLEQEMHRLCHYVSMLAERLPADQKRHPEVTEMLSFGCRSVFHLIRLQTPRIAYETQDKDIDFAPEGVGLRWSAGCRDARRALTDQAWTKAITPDTGIVIHDYATDLAPPVATMAGQSSEMDTSLRPARTRGRVKRLASPTTISRTHPAHRLLPFLLTLTLIALMVLNSGAHAAPDGTHSVDTPYSFTDLQGRLERAIEANGLVVVASASASRGAASRGITIPGNLVLMVFRNDFAVRMLEASIPAGIEAPLRLYLTENADQSSTLSWRMPSAVFAPYGSPQLDALAHELDAIFDAIVGDATR